MRLKYLSYGLPGLLIAVPAFYLLASVAGALIPGSVQAGFNAPSPPGSKKIFLLTGLLHADIAVPVDETVLNRFAFLSRSTLDLDSPGLRYLVFGWGAREFYTTAGTYGDITAAATFKAITGDRSVMRVFPAGRLRESDSVIVVNISTRGFDRLLGFIRASFSNDNAGRPGWLEGESIGNGDVFYSGKGSFNILNPCNTWTGRALRVSGIQAGAWTPTTQSLKLALKFHR